MSSPRERRRGILDEIAGGGHAVIEASAGTGKTWTLENLVVSAVVSGRVSLREILVVTFTDKGARELRSRVRSALEGMLGTGGGEARARIEEALRAFDRATICTIHSFCRQVMDEHPLLTGRSFGEATADGRRMFGSAFRDEARRVLAELGLTRDLLLGILGNGGSLSGIEKDLDLIRRERGVITPAWDRPGLERAFLGMPGPDEIESDMARDLAGIHHSTRKSLSRRASDLARIAQELRQGGSLAAALPALLSWRLGYGSGDAFDTCLDKIPAGLPPSCVAARTRRAIEEIAARAVTPMGALAAVLLPRVLTRLERDKREQGVHDFDDMLVIVRDALEGEAGADLAARIAARFRLALVDEFQDTDAVQWQIFGRVFLAGRGGGSLVVVGDPKQAIYGFRGADVHTYAQARREMADAGGREHALTQNFRSTARLLRALDLVLESGFFSGINEYDGPASCGRPELRALDRDGRDALPVLLVHPGSEPGVQLGMDDLRAAVGECVAAEIEAILDDRAPALRVGTRDDERPLAASDIHVLVRTASEGRGIAEHLRRRGIPHAFFKQDGLFATSEAGDLLHLLAAIEDPADRSARFRAWITPYFGLTVAEAMSSTDVTAADPLISRLLSWKALADAGRWDRLHGAIVEDSGIARTLLLARHGEREITNHLYLLEVLFEEARRRLCTISDLAMRLGAWIDGVSSPPGDEGDIMKLPGERAAVQILTMHKSKGLEAQVVFVAGGLGRTGGNRSPLVYHVDGRRHAHLQGAWMPQDVEAAIAAEAAEEDQRLLYVAMTRARARVYLPYLGAFDMDGQSLPETPAPPLEGCAAILDARLRAMLRETDRSRLIGLFGVLDARVPAGAARPAGPARDLGAWTPPPEPPGTALPDLAAARETHLGFKVTSYSMMKSLAGDSYHPAEEPASTGPAHAEEPASEEPAHEAAASHEGAAGDQYLPGGLSTGTFLHEVLEGIDLAAVAACPTPDGWARTRAAANLLARCASRTGFPVERIPAAARLLHGALRCPVRLGDTLLGSGLCALDRAVAEMEFLYPIPEPWHGTRPGDAPAHVAGRGMVRGFVDLLFEHGGRTFILDWKSDVLQSWDADVVARHVDANYSIQAAVYTLAIVRMLGIRSGRDLEEKMGGVVYCFLRGMAGGSDGRRGIHHFRPSLEEIRGWERALLVHGAEAGREPGVFGMPGGGRG